jgi:hypothetical protein
MGNNIKGFDFKKYATPRIIGGIAIVIIVLWALSIIFGFPRRVVIESVAERPHDSTQATPHSGAAGRINRQSPPACARCRRQRQDRPPRVLPAMAPGVQKPPEPMPRHDSSGSGFSWNGHPGSLPGRTRTKTAAQQTSRSHGATAAGHDRPR